MTASAAGATEVEDMIVVRNCSPVPRISQEAESLLDYGGYGGSSSGFRDDRRGFDEYNAGDDEITAPRRSNSLPTSGASARASTNQASTQATSKAPEKVVDLLGFDDDNYSAGTSAMSAPAPTGSGKAAEKALPSNPLDGMQIPLPHCSRVCR